jgi:hypothetical protein
MNVSWMEGVTSVSHPTTLTTATCETVRQANALMAEHQCQ